MTALIKSWILTVAIFMVLMWALPDPVIYFMHFFKWVAFAFSVLFWFVVALILAMVLMSWWTGIRDRND